MRCKTDFKSSRTLVNLGRAFAGESQARNRYSFYSEQAAQDNLQAVANIIHTISGEEHAHAQAFFNAITGQIPAQLDNLNIDAGYPFQRQDTASNLSFAATAERDEFERIYPSFARIAREEGFAQIADLFERVASVEKGHNSVFSQLHQQLSSGSLYKSEKLVVWRCSHCGFEATAKEPWAVCPLCAHDRGYVQPRLSWWTNIAPEDRAVG